MHLPLRGQPGCPVSLAVSPQQQGYSITFIVRSPQTPLVPSDDNYSKMRWMDGWRPADHPPEPAQLRASSLQAQWLRVPVCGLPSQMSFFFFLPSWLPGKMAHNLAQTSRDSDSTSAEIRLFQGEPAQYSDMLDMLDMLDPTSAGRPTIRSCEFGN